MARVEGGAVVIDTDWPGLKNQIDTRSINFKYEEDATAYEIFAIDGQYFYKTIIYKSGQAPENQATYDTWRADFESNYKDRVTDFNSTQPFYITNVDGYSVVLKDGAAPTANDGYGVALIGYDGSNYRMLKSDSSGRPVLVGAGTAGTPAGGVISVQGVASGTALPVSGTVAATQSGTWTVQPGNTANTTPWLITINQGGNSVAVTGSNALKVDGSAVTQPISGTVTANAGTGTFTVSGTVTANAGTGNFNNASIGSNGSTIPSSSTQVAGSDGTNLQPLRLFDLDSGGGQQWVLGIGLRKASGGGSVEFGTSSDPIRIDPTGTTTQPISGTVTANIGTTNGLALDATLAKLTIAQSTALGSNTQVLIGGSVSTSAPSYSNENINPISLTTAGAIRIDGSAVTQPVSGTVTANAGTGNFTVVQATASNLRAQLASESSTGAAIPSTAVMVGGSDGTNLRSLFVDSSGRQIVVGGAANGAAVSGNPVLIAGSDGTNARSIRTASDGTVRVDPTGTTTQPVSGTVAATQSGTWTVQPGNTANSTPWLITINQGGNSATVTASNALKVDGSAVTQPVSGTVTSNQGTANTLANAWPVKVTDGTNTMPTGDTVGRAIFQKITDGTNTATVKAASTAAVAADPALVVTISPNNSITIGGHADFTATGSLNALNATVSIALSGYPGGGMQLVAGTLIGTIVPEISLDGGTTWVGTFFDDPTTGNKVSSIVFSSSNTATTRTIVGAAGASHVRVRVSAFTSGTATCNLRASDVSDPSILSSGPAASTTQPPAAIQISGWDGTTLRVPAVKAPSTAPVVGDQALVVILSPNQPSIPVTTTTPNSTPDNAKGYVNTSATTNVPLRGTTYTEQSSNFTGSIASASASDAAAGTGARTVRIYYVDATGATAGTEDATLNGTTGVNLVTSTKCFIEKIVVLTVGSGGSNAGIISLYTGANKTGTTVVTIAVGDNQTFLGHHYVVSGKTCNISGMTGFNSNSSNQTVFTIQSQTLPVANQASVQVSDWVTGGLTFQVVRLYDQLIKVTGPAHVQMYAAPGGTPNILNRGSFDFYDA